MTKMIPTVGATNVVIVTAEDIARLHRRSVLAVRSLHEDILVPPDVFGRRDGTVALVCPWDKNRGDLAYQRKYSGETEETHLAGRMWRLLAKDLKAKADTACRWWALN